jgi:hypothetical protein
MAAHNYRGMTPVARIRIARTCPRCRRDLYHHASLYDVDGRKVVRVWCADCAHEWSPRFLVDEWE